MAGNELIELVNTVLDASDDDTTDGARVAAALTANPELVLRALGGEKDDSRRTAFHDWWIVPTERLI